MARYAFWNNKGGTGKTSLIFQSLLEYAQRNINSKILAIDLCPQSNFSDLLLGGLLGNGNNHLEEQHQFNPRRSIGGYFQYRIATPFSVPNIDPENYLCVPHNYNEAVPENINLLAGDQLVEIQTNSIATLSNTSLPGIDPWMAVIDWVNDFIRATESKYNDVFIDMNPSFSIYTQIALAASDRLILPVMADDSSRRAVQNVFSLIHGIDIPDIYQDSSFSRHFRSAERNLPKIHLIVKNRLTQYMGPASAYQSIFTAIDSYIERLLLTNPSVFTFSDYKHDGVVEVRDFQTAGVVAFAKGLPFRNTPLGRHDIFGRESQVKADFLPSCVSAIDDIVDKL